MDDKQQKEYSELQVEQLKIQNAQNEARLKNEPIKDRIENARRNVEALSRIHRNTDDPASKEVDDALLKNIKIMNEVTKIK